MSAEIAGRSVREIARDMLGLARGGLVRRGLGEGRYLDCLDAIVETGREPARVWLERFEGAWRGSIDPVFVEARM